MKELIAAIKSRHRIRGIYVYEPATPEQIDWFEKRIGFELPADFKQFYSICNGFGCTEDIFNMLQLSTILEYQKDYGSNWFYFSEYMIYSDMWGVRITSEGQYEIFNGSFPDRPLTSTLTEFLSRYLNGEVFDPGGLYEWQEELGIK